MIFRARRPVATRSLPATPLVPSPTGDQARPLVAGITSSTSFQFALGNGSVVASWLTAPFVVTPGDQIPVAFVSREIERPGQPGAATSARKTEDYFPPAPPVALRATEAEQAGFLGAAIRVVVVAPFAVPPGALVPRRNVGREVDRPGDPGSATVRGTTAPALPLAGLRLSRLAAQIEPPGEPGRADASASRFPPVVYPPASRTAAIAERQGEWEATPAKARGGPVDPPGHPSRVAGEVERPGDSGLAVSLAYPPPPTVYLPTGQRLTIRELEYLSPPGSVQTIRSPCEHVPTPTVRLGAVAETPIAQLVGWVAAGRTFSPPEPRSPIGQLAQIVEHPQPEGAAIAVSPFDFALPPGALIPRVVMVNELESPGHAGAVRHRKGPHDYTLIVIDPIFLSDSPAMFRTWWNVVDPE